jgi:glycosyltransferase involved in cell wall biosynthesis
MAAAQLQQGHAVRIVCLWHTGDLAERARQAGVAVSCCDKGPGIDWRSILRLRAELRAARADVLHTHNAMAHYYAVAASLGLGIRSVISTRHGAGAKSAADRVEKLYKLAMRATDFGVAVSRAGRQRYVDTAVIPEAKARAIPNGIELGGFVARSDERARALRIELGLPPDALTFGTVGRLNEVKRQVDLLRATRARLDAGDLICLILVGDGPMRAELEQERERLGLADHVRLLGVRTDVPALLSAMDVFVLCSRSEGYSLALVEAAAAALPIIATDVGGNAEIVADGVNGLIVPPADAAALQGAMARLQADTPWRQRFGAASRAWALREGTLQAMCDAYDVLYRA